MYVQLYVYLFVSIKDGVWSHLDDELTGSHCSIFGRQVDDSSTAMVLEVSHVCLQKETETVCPVTMDCPEAVYKVGYM